MIFLQPLLLYGLPLALLPLLIHLLNRLRYRSQPWAAMIFLRQATRSSTRHAKLRQWLILLCRVLVLLFLVLALARPQVGGWLGLAFSGPPDTVVLLLDRSASMETLDERTHQSKRAYALQQLAAAARGLGPGTRLVLIDSALRRPQEIAAAGQLPELPLTRATDTAADLPAMLRAAVEYLLANRRGRTELWIASDLQRSNWQPESSQWPELAAQLANLPQDLKVRLLALTGGGDNLALGLRDAWRARRLDGSELRLDLSLVQGAPRPVAVQVGAELNGNPLPPLSLRLESTQLDCRQRLDLGDRKGGGWGRLTLPADANARDNGVYFVYGDEQPLRAAVFAEAPALRSLLAVAAAPAPEALNQSAVADSPGKLAATSLDQAALVIWQGALPDEPAQRDRLRAFAAAGGSLLLLPGDGAAGPRLFEGTGWGEVENAPPQRHFPVAHWDGEQGPLAKGASGHALPVDSLRVLRRRHLEGTGQLLAGFADGKPFLLRRQEGAGQVLWLATLPDPAWSDLGEGLVLVPMLQRLLADGGKRLSPGLQACCGELPAARLAEDWRPLESGAALEYPWQAGVYQRGQELLALNRPPAEDDRLLVEESELHRCFGKVNLHLLSEAGQGGERLQSEVWRSVLLALLLALVAESWLTLPGTARRTAREEPA